MLATVPKTMMARKPPHGSPCTRCGACCYVVLCELGKHVFASADHPRGPCPALVRDDNGYSCGLTLIGTAQHRAAASLLIGAGDGCDARFNGETVNHPFYEKLERLDEVRAEEIGAARKIWRLPLTKG